MWCDKLFEKDNTKYKCLIEVKILSFTCNNNI